MEEFVGGYPFGCTDFGTIYVGSALTGGQSAAQGGQECARLHPRASDLPG
jgi:hypothetical protein